MRLVHRPLPLLTWALCASLALTACPADDDDDTAGGDNLVDAAGGQVIEDGVLFDIPAGALSEEVEITVERAASTMPGAITDTFTFGPDGLTFAAPVFVSFELDGEPAEPVAVYWSDESGALQRLVTTVEGGRASAWITHFSVGLVGHLHDPGCSPAQKTACESQENLVCSNALPAPPPNRGSRITGTSAYCADSAGTCTTVQVDADCTNLPGASGACNIGPITGPSSLNAGVNLIASACSFDLVCDNGRYDCDGQFANGCESTTPCASNCTSGTADNTVMAANVSSTVAVDFIAMDTNCLEYPWATTGQSGAIGETVMGTDFPSGPRTTWIVAPGRVATGTDPTVAGATNQISKTVPAGFVSFVLSYDKAGGVAAYWTEGLQPGVPPANTQRVQIINLDPSSSGVTAWQVGAGGNTRVGNTAGYEGGSGPIDFTWPQDEYPQLAFDLNGSTTPTHTIGLDDQMTHTNLVYTGGTKIYGQFINERDGWSGWAEMDLQPILR